MLRPILIFLVFFSFAVNLPAEERKTLRIAYTSYPPFFIETKDPKHPTGVLTEFWEKQVAKLAHVDIDWIGPVSHPRAKKMVMDGEADAINSIPLESAKKEHFVYSKKVRFFGRQGIAIRKEDPMTALRRPSDLNGKVIAKFGAGYMPDFFKNSGVRISELITSEDSVTRCFQMLFLNRVWGVYLVSAEVAPYYTAKMGKPDSIKILLFPDTIPAFVASIGLSPKMKAEDADKILRAAEHSDPKIYDFEKTLNHYIREAEKEAIAEAKVKK